MIVTEQLPPLLLVVVAIATILFTPGAAIARSLDLHSPAMHLLAILLISLAATYAAGTLLGLLHVSLHIWRNLAFFLFVLGFLAVVARTSFDYLKQLRSPEDGTQLSWNDLSAFIVSFCICWLAFKEFTYDERGILIGTDIISSWWPWARSWALGKVPATAYGYPQFIPIIWSSAYWFLGNAGEIVLRPIYGIMIFAPVLLSGWHLQRQSPARGSLILICFAVSVASMQGSWIRGSLPAGYPDWIAASFCVGAFYLLVPAFEAGIRRMVADEGTQPVVLAGTMFAVAASIKLVCGVFLLGLVVAVAIERNTAEDPSLHRIQRALAGVVAGTVVLFLAYYVLVRNSSLPPFVRKPSLWDQLRDASAILLWHFPIWMLPTLLIGLPLVVARGNVLTRCMAAAIVAGLAMWLRFTAYDARAALPFAFSGLVLVVACSWPAMMHLSPGNAAYCTRSRILMPTALFGLLVLVASLLVVPLSQQQLRTQHAYNQETWIGEGRALNGGLLTLLNNHCRVISFYSYAQYVDAIHAFAKPGYLIDRPPPEPNRYLELGATQKSGSCVGLLVDETRLKEARANMDLSGFELYRRSGDWSLLIANSPFPLK